MKTSTHTLHAGIINTSHFISTNFSHLRPIVKSFCLFRAGCGNRHKRPKTYRWKAVHKYVLLHIYFFLWKFLNPSITKVGKRKSGQWPKYFIIPVTGKQEQKLWLTEFLALLFSIDTEHHRSNLFLTSLQWATGVTIGIEMRSCVNENLKRDFFFLLFSETTRSKYLMSRQIHISSGTSSSTYQKARSTSYTAAEALNTLITLFLHDAHGNTGFPS